MRTQHYDSCRGHLPGRTPWRPFTCASCDAIERDRAQRRVAWEHEVDRFIQHGRGENP